MTEFNSITKNTEKEPFVIVGESTEPKKNLRVKRIAESDIAFLLDIKNYSCDYVNSVL